MSLRILLALALGACCLHLSVQMMPSTIAHGAFAPTQQNMEVPCSALSTLKSGGGVIQVSRVRNIQGEQMCTLPVSHMPRTIDELIESEERVAAAYAGTSVPCKGVIINMDMCLTRRQYEILRQYHTLDNFHSGRWKRKALDTMAARWTNKVVPYEIKDGVFSTSETELIKQAMREWESGTCLSFRPANQFDTDRVVFQSGTGCYSRIGRVGGSQEISLGTGVCRMKHVIMHEIGHAIGLIHEHQRDDRDNHVTILTENVKPEFISQFDKISRSIVGVDSTKYDYYSLMHYGKTFFSKDGKSVTIKTNDPAYEDVIGRVEKLSFTDFKAVNIMYQCSEFCPNRVYCVNGGYAGPNCECVCPDGSGSCTARVVSRSRVSWRGDRRLGTYVPPPRPFGRSSIRFRSDRLRQRGSGVMVSVDQKQKGTVGHTNGYQSQVESQGQGRPHFKVIDRQTQGGRDIIQLSTSNVSAALQAIMDSTNNDPNAITSQITREAPYLSVGQVIRPDGLSQSGQRIGRNQQIIAVRGARPAAKLQPSPVTSRSRRLIPVRPQGQPNQPSRYAGTGPQGGAVTGPQVFQSNIFNKAPQQTHHSDSLQQRMIAQFLPVENVQELSPWRR